MNGSQRERDSGKWKSLRLVENTTAEISAGGAVSSFEKIENI
jgi:hypothetical protein